MIVSSTPTAGMVEMSLADLDTALDGHLTHEVNRPYCQMPGLAENMRTRSEWYGGLRSTEAARKVFSVGWSAGAKRLADVAQGIAPPAARSRKRRATWSDEGDDLRIDRAMAGDWDQAWRTSKRVWTAGSSHVTLFASFGGHAGRSEDALFWSGAASLIVADRLESAGYAVRVVASRPVRSHMPGAKGMALRADVVVKESEDPIQIDALAALMCHSGIFRTYGLAAVTAMPAPVGSGLGGEGTFADFLERFQDAGMWPDNAIVMDSAYSRESCIASIRAALAGAGVEDPT